MNQYPRHLEIDFSKFDPKNNEPETKYGLPKDVKFCKTCVISNQRPNSAVEFKHTSETSKSTINFDENGVCDACHVADEKQKTMILLTAMPPAETAAIHLIHKTRVLG